MSQSAWRLVPLLIALPLPLACGVEGEPLPGGGVVIVDRDDDTSDPTPEDPTPEDPTPEDPTPEDPTPEDPTPEDPTPEDPTPPADCPRVQVTGTGGAPLNVRATPSTADAPVGQLAAGAFADVTDVTDGEAIDGETTWYRVSSGPLDGWISGAFASCRTDDPPEALEGFLLPLGCGTSASVTQSNHSSFSHNGKAAYAFDFGLTSNTPLVAMNDGVVILARSDIGPGDACYSGGGSECANTVNYVVVDHGDATATLYLHLNEASVAVGDTVLRGQTVGLSGGTGWSTGPHAHVQRQEVCGSWWCQSVPLDFSDVAGDGVPAAGETVVSENGCF
jgi:hypothetical protein